MKELDILAADLLETAADKLESGEYGWTRGRTFGHRNEVCAIGALAKATELPLSDMLRPREIPKLLKAAEALVEHVRPRVEAALRDQAQEHGIHDSVYGVTVWNDRVAEDVTEIVEGMKVAAKDLRNRA